MKALQASEDLRKLTLGHIETMNAEEQEQLKAIRQKKLIELKNRLQENADSEFSEFKGKFDLVHKPLRK
jgi:predicted ATP-grasp superfamily ATP-dependent carboligase